MRFFYLDPGLLDDVGHHANYCRYIVGALRARGVETLVFGHSSVAPALQSELRVVPHFKTFTYTRLDVDPVAGWLHDFDTLTSGTSEDLRNLPSTSTTDIVYASSVNPAQLRALVDWRQTLSPDLRPALIVECCEPGLTIERTPQGSRPYVPSPQVDATATLFRFVASRLPREPAARFHAITFCPATTELLNRILEYPVRTLPLPYAAVTSLRNRAGARAPVVAVLGHQRNLKGYDRLPEIVDRILHARSNVRLLLQVVRPGGQAETLDALHDIALRNDRVTLDERAAGKIGWPRLLSATDLALCPHRAEFYSGTFSSVAAEALANGIPLVVPAGTTLESLVTEWGGAGTTFDRFEVSSILAATEEALDRFDHVATQAYQAALEWPKTHGPAPLVDALISLVT